MRKRSTPPSELSHRWYLSEWARRAGKRQADAQRDLGWSKASASHLWNGHQRYTQDLVDAASRWLGIQPFELLMRPEEAEALRRIRQTAAMIVAEDQTGFEHAPPLGKKRAA